MTSSIAQIVKGTIAIILVAFSMNSASAQTAPAKSRVAVVANDTKTNIWVSDFPKNTSIMIFDSEDNLLSMTSTNDFGALFLSLPKGIKTGVIVKTVDGEITVSNKSVIKNKQEEQNIVSNDRDMSTIG